VSCFWTRASQFERTLRTLTRTEDGNSWQMQSWGTSVTILEVLSSCSGVHMPRRRRPLSIRCLVCVQFLSIAKYRCSTLWNFKQVCGMCLQQRVVSSLDEPSSYSFEQLIVIAISLSIGISSTLCVCVRLCSVCTDICSAEVGRSVWSDFSHPCGFSNDICRYPVVCPRLLVEYIHSYIYS
jgi:hypothetical protein